MIDRAAEIIRAGGLVAFPTETVYGLGANALDASAVRRIFEVKGRPATSPLIVHVASVEMALEVVRDWPRVAGLLAERYWPGPLTLVLPKHERVPAEVTAGLDTVGVRMPAHPVALGLVRAAGVPIAAPSANRFTQLSPTTAEHVRAGLGSAVDLVLDGGSTDVGIESTVLSLVGQPALLRPGILPVTELEEFVGPLIRVASAEGPHPSPGLHERHYSPRTPLYVTRVLPPGHGAYVWWNMPSQAAMDVRLPAKPKDYARAIYAVLHELDGRGLDYIAVEPVPDTPAWDGVRDRLKRASVDSVDF